MKYFKKSLKPFLSFQLGITRDPVG